MRLTATLGALFLALVALLGGLVFWAAAAAIIIMPALERSPIRFLPQQGYWGFMFVMAAVTAGLLLLVCAYGVVGWVMDKAFTREELPVKQTTPTLSVVEGGKPPSPPV